MFEEAVRKKLRFDHKKGQISVEDLGDLPLEDLDQMYQNLVKTQRDRVEGSLLQKKDQESEIIQLKIDIVKHVVQIRLEEQRQREFEAKRSQEREKVKEILQRKKDGRLEEYTVEELEDMLKQYE